MRTKMEAIGVAASVCLLVAGGVFAQDSSGVTRIGSLYHHVDRVESIAVSGNLAYVATVTTGLAIVDLSDPVTPRGVGFCTTAGFAYGVTVSGNYCYVADCWEGLSVVDVSDPTQPQVVGSCQTPGWANRAAVEGNYCYVADRESGICIINVQNPANPRLIGYFNTPGVAMDVAVSGQYCYVADEAGGLLVLDVADPSNPVQLARVVSSGAVSVTLNGEHCYVADQNSGLKIVNVSDPSNPEVVAIFESRCTDAAISGNLCILAAMGIFEVLDIADLNSPRILASLNISFTQDLAIIGEMVFVAAGNLRVVDIQDPEHPRLVGRYRPDGPVGHIAKQNNFCVVSAGSQLRFIDVEDPYTSREIRRMEGGPAPIAIEGNFCYAGGLSIIDIEDPTAPSIIGSVVLEGNSANALTVSGDYCYVSGSESGVSIVDISNPASPRQMGSWDTPGLGSANDVAVAGQYCYVASDTVDEETGTRVGCLVVLDVNNPRRPRVASISYMPDEATGVAIAGDYCYVTNIGHGLRVFDIHDPIHPQQIGYLEVLGAWKIVIDGEHAYISAMGQGIQIVDISDPSHPRRVGYYDTPGIAWECSAARNYVYVADEQSFGIYNCSDALTALPKLMPQPLSFAFDSPFPNPFNSSTTIRFSLPAPSLVRLAAYDLSGRVVEELTDKNVYPPGEHTVVWDGSGLTAGVYLVRLDAGGEASTVKAVIIK